MACRGTRRELFNADPHCYWCGCEVIWWDRTTGQMPGNAATVDHLHSRFSPPHLRKPPYQVKLLACLACNARRSREEQAALKATPEGRALLMEKGAIQDKWHRRKHRSSERRTVMVGGGSLGR